MTNLFYCTTSYHLILAINLAFQRGSQDNNYLIYAPVHASHFALCESMVRWQGCPFEDVNIIHTSIPRKRPISWFNKIYQARMQAPRIIEDIKPDYIFACKDRDPLVQSLLHHSSGSTNVYFEDGLAAYITNFYETPSIWETLFRVLAFGAWYVPVQVYGTSKWIGEVALTHPEYVRGDLSGKIITEIDGKYIRHSDKSWISRFLRDYDVNIKEILAVDKIIFADHSSIVHDIDRYIKLANKIINNASSLGYNIAVKYHPREHLDYLNLLNSESIKVIPSSISSEIIFLMSERLQEVYSSVSTCLISAKWINPSLNVTFVDYKNSMNKYNMDDVIRGLNVDIMRM